MNIERVDTSQVNIKNSQQSVPAAPKELRSSAKEWALRVALLGIEEGKGGMALSASERKLISRAIHREPEAFSELYLKYKPLVLRHIYYLVGNKQEAEDITSETFLRAWNSIERFEERGFSIRSWLLRIGYNLRAEHFRHRSRVTVTRDIAAVEDQIIDPDPMVSPELLAESTSRWQYLWRAIQALPKPQRQVIILRFLNDLSYEEVQGIMGKSLGATRVIQHRALKSLHRSLEDGDFDFVSRRVAVAEATQVPVRAAGPLRVAAADD